MKAIEGFALMVKRTAQILQSFGTELAETELPNDIQATSNLLGTHINKKSKMKVQSTHTHLPTDR